jgi:hypothetical protein
MRARGHRGAGGSWRGAACQGGPRTTSSFLPDLNDEAMLPHMPRDRVSARRGRRRAGVGVWRRAWRGAARRARASRALAPARARGRPARAPPRGASVSGAPALPSGRGPGRRRGGAPLGDATRQIGAASWARGSRVAGPHALARGSMRAQARGGARWRPARGAPRFRCPRGGRPGAPPPRSPFLSSSFFSFLSPMWSFFSRFAMASRAPRARGLPFLRGCGSVALARGVRGVGNACGDLLQSFGRVLRHAGPGPLGRARPPAPEAAAGPGRESRGRGRGPGGASGAAGGAAAARLGAFDEAGCAPGGPGRRPEAGRHTGSPAHSATVRLWPAALSVKTRAQGATRSPACPGPRTGRRPGPLLVFGSARGLHTAAAAAASLGGTKDRGRHKGVRAGALAGGGRARLLPRGARGRRAAAARGRSCCAALAAGPGPWKQYGRVSERGSARAQAAGGCP